MSGSVTGDVRNNLAKLHSELRSVHYEEPIDDGRLLEGDPLYYEKLLHFSTHQFSRPLGRYLAENGFDLHTQFGERFADNVLKFLRMEFQYMSPLSAALMSSTGYGERKIIFLTDVIRLCKHKHNELHRSKQKKKETSSSVSTDSADQYSLSASTTRDTSMKRAGRAVSAPRTRSSLDSKDGTMPSSRDMDTQFAGLSSIRGSSTIGVGGLRQPVRRAPLAGTSYGGGGGSGGGISGSATMVTGTAPRPMTTWEERTSKVGETSSDDPRFSQRWADAPSTSTTTTTTTAISTSAPISVPTSSGISSATSTQSRSMASSKRKSGVGVSESRSRATAPPSTYDRFREAVGYDVTDLGSTIRDRRKQQAIEEEMSSKKNDGNEAIVVRSGHSTRVLGMDIQEVFILLSKRMEKLEATVSKKIDNVEARMTLVEGKMKILDAQVSVSHPPVPPLSSHAGGGTMSSFSSSSHQPPADTFSHHGSMSFRDVDSHLDRLTGRRPLSASMSLSSSGAKRS
eukprot:TRINITY_DN15601_c0_g1_i1.p1 TRINITY_DN15601_c0_g1~~TRINITY_DN15601_c0_g1_i1.p1  ORF type:complete len:512 (+),score=149.00 TRINITY_DN15601_c0_g1_i1:68-1603(+)